MGRAERIVHLTGESSWLPNSFSSRVWHISRFAPHTRGRDALRYLIKRSAENCLRINAQVLDRLGHSFPFHESFLRQRVEGGDDGGFCERASFRNVCCSPRACQSIPRERRCRRTCQRRGSGHPPELTSWVCRSI